MRKRRSPPAAPAVAAQPHPRVCVPGPFAALLLVRIGPVPAVTPAPRLLRGALRPRRIDQGVPSA